jgi:hypothetical protein
MTLNYADGDTKVKKVARFADLMSRVNLDDLN